METTNFIHGINGYRTHKCRCAECRAAVNLAEKERRAKRRAQGIESTPKKRYPLVCQYVKCGAEFLSTNRQAQVCSNSCGAKRRYTKSTDLVIIPKTRSWSGHEIISKLRWTNGQCVHCSKWFVSLDYNMTARYCSDYCSRVVRDHRRAELRGYFYISPKDRQSIYERDEWTCQLCFKDVDPFLDVNDRWSATLDHIICQSWTESPDHSPTNLRLAHRHCNSSRGARM